MESGCRPPGGPTTGSSRRALRLHRSSQARESVPGPRLPFLAAGGKAAQRVMSAAPGAGPGDATATRGSAHQVRRENEAADWRNRGERRAHGGGGDAHGCGAAVRVLTRPTLGFWGALRAAFPLQGLRSRRQRLLPPACGKSGHRNLPELTCSHCLGCVGPRPPHHGHPENPANHRRFDRTPGASPGRVQPPFLKSATPTFPRVGKASALQKRVGKGVGPDDVCPGVCGSQENFE